jgi:hypothetical protein
MKLPGEFFSLGRGTNCCHLIYVKNVLGMGMSPSEIKACYRLYAAHCLEIAQRLSDRGGKIALLNMAQTWIALADQIEKAKGASRGVLHPRSDEP